MNLTEREKFARQIRWLKKIFAGSLALTLGMGVTAILVGLNGYFEIGQLFSRAAFVLAIFTIAVELSWIGSVRATSSGEGA